MNTPVIMQCQIRDVEFGNNVTIIEPVNLYRCKIGDDCFIGPFVEIQKGVTIGARSKIQSHAFVCEMVTIGSDCVIAHGVMFINDPYSIGGPTRGNHSLWKETRIGDHVSIGSNATILPRTICENVVIGAGSVVTRDISESGIYAGNPAKLLRYL
jgi:acetyltransferase-like isoleucine patch superfamily enzyme